MKKDKIEDVIDTLKSISSNYHIAQLQLGCLMLNGVDSYKRTISGCFKIK